MYCTFLWSESIFDLFANFDMPAVLLDYARSKMAFSQVRKKYFGPKHTLGSPLKFVFSKHHSGLKSKKKVHTFHKFIHIVLYV